MKPKKVIADRLRNDFDEFDLVLYFKAFLRIRNLFAGERRDLQYRLNVNAFLFCVCKGEPGEAPHCHWNDIVTPRLVSLHDKQSYFRRTVIILIGHFGTRAFFEDTLFAYLFPVCWIIPAPVPLSVSVGFLGGRLTLDLYAQSGLVVLIGLGRQERHLDRRIRQGAEEQLAALRCRYARIRWHDRTTDPLSPVGP